MIVLGIDPGFGRVGWGAVDHHEEKQVALDYGCIETNPKHPLEKRIATIYTTIGELIKKFHPDVIATEDLFFSTNVTTALSVGQARGVIMLAAYQNHIPTYLYKPMEIKICVTGHGRSDKSQIQHMIKLILKLDSLPKPDDAADALAIALTHCYSHKLSQLDARR